MVKYEPWPTLWSSNISNVAMGNALQMVAFRPANINFFLIVDFPASHGQDHRKGLPDSLQGFWQGDLHQLWSFTFMLGLESQIFDEKTWKTAENPGAKHGATHEKLWKKTWSKTWTTSGRKGRSGHFSWSGAGPLKHREWFLGCLLPTSSVVIPLSDNSFTSCKVIIQKIGEHCQCLRRLLLQWQDYE